MWEATKTNYTLQVCAFVEKVLAASETAQVANP